MLYCKNRRSPSLTTIEPDINRPASLPDTRITLNKIVFEFITYFRFIMFKKILCSNFQLWNEIYTIYKTFFRKNMGLGGGVEKY